MTERLEKLIWKQRIDDGRYLVYTEFHPETGADLWLVDVTGDHPSRVLLRTPFAEKEAVFSPDGRWLAMCSNGVEVKRKNCFGGN